jgi:pyruvate/2-oxoglutarate dehydrogenase complex dihydrolipoamide dehydrogenase (E3) component
MIVEPLRDITKHLQKKVLVKQSILTSLYFEQDQWVVGIKSENKTEYLKSRYVVLATGSHPRKLQYPTTKEIPLDIAVDKAQLAKQVVPEDVVGVLGSAHSAILILKFLSELPVKKIVNFYKNPIVYATEMGDWVLHQHSGLKGITAEWAKNVLEKNPPKNLVRIFNDPKIMARLLPLCTKIIYAVGFDRNQLPLIDGKTEITYDDHTGIIASRLFGIGIAFPEKYVDPLGNVEHQVGLKFFMEYAQKMVPEWMKKDVLRYFSFEDLFMINVL